MKDTSGIVAGVQASSVGAPSSSTLPASMPVQACPAIPTDELVGELTKKAESKSFYQPELDCLRFAAFMAVFLYHCFPSGPQFYQGWPHIIVSFIGATMTAGAFGVALFFALSSYLITNLLLREKETRGSLDARSFYLRRILRIWPLYFAFVAFAALLPLTFASQHLPFSYIAGYSLLAGNWVYVFLGVPQSVAGPLWSVSIEEQFYLAWPLVVRRASRASLAKIAVVLLVAAIASRVLLAFVHAPVRATVFNTISCIDPIALGILLALVLKEPPNLSTVQTRCSVSGIDRLDDWGLRLSYLDRGWGNVIGRSLVAFACIGVLVSFLGSKNRWIRHPALLYLGKVSYGLYVIHLFGWLCGVHILRESPARYQTLAGRLELAGLALVITITGAAISYQWFESPFLRLKERFTYVHSRPV